MLSSPWASFSKANSGTGTAVTQVKGKHAFSVTAPPHLWCAPPPDRRKQKSPSDEEEARVLAVRVPTQSPLRRVDWWRRPPSPLLPLKRPLWESASGSSSAKNPALSAENPALLSWVTKSARGVRKGARASSLPGEGEAAAGGERLHLKLEVAQGDQLPFPTTLGSSTRSQDLTFFARQTRARPSGGWSLSAINAAPPPPPMTAPTPSSSGAVAASRGIPTAKGGLRVKTLSAEVAAPVTQSASVLISSSSSLARPGIYGSSEATVVAAMHGNPTRGSHNTSLQEQRRLERFASMESSSDSGKDSSDDGRPRPGGSAGSEGDRSGVEEDRLPRAVGGEDGSIMSQGGSLEGSLLSTPRDLTKLQKGVNESGGGGEQKLPADGSCSGGGGRADAAARGGGGGNPAGPLSNSLVMKCTETYRLSVLKGLASAIAEVQTDCSGDDDDGGRGVSGRPDGEQHGGHGGSQHQFEKAEEGSSTPKQPSGLGLGLPSAVTSVTSANQNWEREDVRIPRSRPSCSSRSSRSSSCSWSGTGSGSSSSINVGDGSSPRSISARGGPPPTAAEAQALRGLSAATRHRRGEAPTVMTAAAAAMKGAGPTAGKRQAMMALPSAAPSAGESSVEDRPPSPASSLASSKASYTSASSVASSSLATSMRTKSRRVRRSEPRVTRGTRPEREVSGTLRLPQQGKSRFGPRSNRSATELGRRKSWPSPKSPHRVCGNKVRLVDSGRRAGQPDTRMAYPATGRDGIGLRPGAEGSGPIQTGRGSIRWKSWRGVHGNASLRFFSSATKGVGFERYYYTRNVEQHYVNPMKTEGRSGSGVSPKDGDMAAREHKGGVAKLLRKFGILRSRWRSKKSPGPTAAPGKTRSEEPHSPNGSLISERVEFLEENTWPGYKARTDGRGEVLGLDGPGSEASTDWDGEELEMACRRLLDALWMSAKRGSDTLQLSVVDGRSLLAGLLGGLAPPATPRVDPQTGEVEEDIWPLMPLVDLGIPLSSALGALSARKGGSVATARRPVLVGASGPFARAAREAGLGRRDRGGSSIRSTSSSGRTKKREMAALQRAMDTAMGIESDKERHRPRIQGRGEDGTSSVHKVKTVGRKHKADGEGKDSHREWATSPYQPAPSDGRVRGRQLASRARVHRQLRVAASAGLALGGGDGSKGGDAGVSVRMDHPPGNRRSSFPLQSRSSMPSLILRGRSVGGGSTRSSIEGSVVNYLSSVGDDESSCADDESSCADDDSSRYMDGIVWRGTASEVGRLEGDATSDDDE